MSAAELNLRLPLMAPPPNWRGMPSIGNVRTFALLIEFTDTPHTNTQATIDAALFGAPTTGAPYESLAAYYKRASYNKLNISGSTLGWYKVNKKREDIAQTTAGREALIKEAINHFNQQGHDFKQYDNNGNGVIDYFIVFWTGPDNGWANFWWGYQTNFTDDGFKVDGVSLGRYSWQWEANPVGSVFSPHVVIHETGHALGLPDLYDYDGNKGPDGGVGGADMMDANHYDHNSFSKWILDWVQPTVIGNGIATITLKDAGTSQECVAIWPDIDSQDVFGELFIVENRQKTGNDIQFPTSGLMVWHVDGTLSDGGYAYDNAYTTHKLIRLMEADGKEEIEAGGGFNAGDLYMPGKAFGRSTTPASTRYDGKPSTVQITDIVASGTKITATYAVGPSADDSSGTTGGYVVALDGGKSVTGANPLTVSFTLPASLDLASPAVVQYRMLHNGNVGLHVRVTANGGYWEQANNFQGTSWHTFHNVLRAGTLKKGSNTLMFSIQGGAGSLDIEEVVVLYRTR